MEGEDRASSGRGRHLSIIEYRSCFHAQTMMPSRSQAVESNLWLICDGQYVQREDQMVHKLTD